LENDRLTGDLIQREPEITGFNEQAAKIYEENKEAQAAFCSELKN